jgi:hypothetical protein
MAMVALNFKLCRWLDIEQGEMRCQIHYENIHSSIIRCIYWLLESHSEWTAIGLGRLQGPLPYLEKGLLFFGSAAEEE